MLYAIALAGLIGLAIVVERAVFFFGAGRIRPAALLAGIERELKSGGREAALRFVTEQRSTPLVRLAKSALMNLRDVQGALDEALLCETPRLDARTEYVATLAKTASLVGLLGTLDGVQRLVRSTGYPFAGYTGMAGVLDSMSGAAAGMVVALPLLVAYALLTQRTNTLYAELQQTSARLTRYLR